MSVGLSLGTLAQIIFLPGHSLYVFFTYNYRPHTNPFLNTISTRKVSLANFNLNPPHPFPGHTGELKDILLHAVKVVVGEDEAAVDAGCGAGLRGQGHAERIRYFIAH